MIILIKLIDLSDDRDFVPKTQISSSRMLGPHPWIKDLLPQDGQVPPRSLHVTGDWGGAFTVPCKYVSTKVPHTILNHFTERRKCVLQKRHCLFHTIQQHTFLLSLA